MDEKTQNNTELSAAQRAIMEAKAARRAAAQAAQAGTAAPKTQPVPEQRPQPAKQPQRPEAKPVQPKQKPTAPLQRTQAPAPAKAANPAPAPKSAPQTSSQHTEAHAQRMADAMAKARAQQAASRSAAPAQAEKTTAQSINADAPIKTAQILRPQPSQLASHPERRAPVNSAAKPPVNKPAAPAAKAQPAQTNGAAKPLQAPKKTQSAQVPAPNAAPHKATQPAPKEADGFDALDDFNFETLDDEQPAQTFTPAQKAVPAETQHQIPVHKVRKALEEPTQADREAQSSARNVRHSGVFEHNETVYETTEISHTDLEEAMEAPRKKSKGAQKKSKGARGGEETALDTNVKNPGVVAVRTSFPWEKLLLSVCIVVFVISAFLLGQYYISTGIEKQNLENVAADVITAQKNDDGTVSADALILQQYSALAAQNSDMVGWLTIDGSTVNAPVMYTPDDPEYYLTHDFEKKYSQSGMLFMDATCVPNSVGSNMVIYGHNMKNNTMFSDIEKYVEPSYVDAHPVIRFDSLTERAQYQVFAVFNLDTSEGNENSMQCYYYRSTSDLPKHAYFLDYVREYAAIYLEDNLPKAGDTLITLSTCDNVTPNGRIVVMAKKILTAAPAAESEASSTAQ